MEFSAAAKLWRCCRVAARRLLQLDENFDARRAETKNGDPQSESPLREAANGGSDVAVA